MVSTAVLAHLLSLFGNVLACILSLCDGVKRLLSSAIGTAANQPQPALSEAKPTHAVNFVDRAVSLLLSVRRLAAVIVVRTHATGNYLLANERALIRINGPQRRAKKDHLCSQRATGVIGHQKELTPSTAM
jgi:hypothetical protein